MIKLFGTNLITSICSVLISFVFTFIASKIYSPENFGDIRYVMTLVPLFMIFGFPGFDRVILKSGFDKKRINVFSIVIFRLFSSSLVCTIFFVFFMNTDYNYSNILLLALLFIPIYEVFNSYKNYLIGRGFANKAANLFFISRLSSLIIYLCLLFISFVLKVDYVYYIPMYIISLSLPQVYIFFNVFLKSKRNAFKFPQLSIVKSGVLTTFGGSVSTLAFSLDKILVFHYLGAKQLALYSILMMFPQQASNIIDSFIPYVYKQLNIKRKFNVKWLVSFLTIPVFYIIVFSLFSDVVFGPEYYYSYKLISITVIYSITQSLEFVSTQKLFIGSSNKNYILLSLFNLCVSYILISLLLVYEQLFFIVLALIIKNILSMVFSNYLRLKYE